MECLVFTAMYRNVSRMRSDMERNVNLLLFELIFAMNNFSPQEALAIHGQ